MDPHKQVIWNNEMTLCVGLKTDLDQEEFIDQVLLSHLELTSEPIKPSDGTVTEAKDTIWIFEIKLEEEQAS